MADIADVMDLLQSMAVAAIYPSGIIIPPMAGKTVNIAQGWPAATAVNDTMAAGNSLVSIYALPSSTGKLPVPLSPSGDGQITAPVHGMTAAVTATGFTITGNPGTGEYVAALANFRAYSYSTVPGDTAATVMAALAALIPGASVVNGSVVLSIGASIRAVRIGAPAIGGQIIDRQRQNISVCTWAPNPSDRSAIGIQLDLAVKRTVTVQYPDTSTGINVVQTTNLIDKYQDELSFRRDMIVQCQWDTVDQYPNYEVTVVAVTESSSTNPAPQHSAFNY